MAAERAQITKSAASPPGWLCRRAGPRADGHTTDSRVRPLQVAELGVLHRHSGAGSKEGLKDTQHRRPPHGLPGLSRQRGWSPWAFHTYLLPVKMGWGLPECTLASEDSHPPCRLQASTLLLQRSPTARPRPHGGLGAGPGAQATSHGPEWRTAPPLSIYGAPTTGQPSTCSTCGEPSEELTLHRFSSQQTPRAPGARFPWLWDHTWGPWGGEGRLLVEMGVWGGWGPRVCIPGAALRSLNCFM